MNIGLRSTRWSASSSQLSRRYSIALLLIAVLTIASQVIIQTLIADQEHDSRLINIAGRQRMLSQKITKTSHYIVHNAHDVRIKQYRQELQDALRLWQLSHHGLQHGDQQMGLPGNNSQQVKDLFKTIKSHYNFIVNACNSILQFHHDREKTQQALKIIEDNEAHFLAGMNDIVFLYDQEAKSKVDLAGQLETILMCITLIVLVLEARFIFSPATKRLNQQMKKIAEVQTTLEYNANHDALTGLPNRRGLRSLLQTELRNSANSNSKVALLLLDLDHFKDVNDTLGHDVGDLLLQQVTRRILDKVRSSDIVARLGGDEFVIVLGDLKQLDYLETVINSILKQIEEPFNIVGNRIFVSASLGVTVYPDDGLKIENLLKNADQAMYAAKKTGRNRYKHFKPSMYVDAAEKIRLIELISLALERQQFLFYYQSIIELATGKVCKAEALIRWQHPQFGLISPGDFIPVAESTNFINQIGDLAFQEATQQLAIWRDKFDAQFQISVNMSAAQFRRQDNFFDAWCQRLSHLKLSGSGITLEITESSLLDSNHRVKKLLLNFNQAGFNIAIDDFGTGYSSLSYIKKFAVDYIKIDQSFVKNMLPNSNEAALCEAIISMAHKLKMKVIAEGVETKEQQLLLLEMGCDFAQGYLYSKPVPADQFELMLKQKILEPIYT